MQDLPQAHHPEVIEAQGVGFVQLLVEHPKFAVSFLKAMYGDAATKENDWAFHYLPKIDRKYSWVENWDGMYNGKVKGLVRLRHERRR